MGVVLVVVVAMVMVVVVVVPLPPPLPQRTYTHHPPLPEYPPSFPPPRTCLARRATLSRRWACCGRASTGSPLSASRRACSPRSPPPSPARRTSNRRSRTASQTPTRTNQHQPTLDRHGRNGRDAMPHPGHVRDTSGTFGTSKEGGALPNANHDALHQPLEPRPSAQVGEPDDPRGGEDLAPRAPREARLRPVRYTGK